MLSSAKKDTRLYHLKHGWSTVVYNDQINLKVMIITDHEQKRVVVNYDGKEGRFNETPMVFWDKPKIEIPEKPFDLKAEYKKLKRKEFVYGVNNYIIALKRDSDFDDVEVWYSRESSEIKMVGTCHYERDYIEEFTKSLNNHEITFEQLGKVIKEVENENRKRD